MIQKFHSLRMITGGGNHILILKNTSALRRQWSNLGKQYGFFLIFVPVNALIVNVNDTFCLTSILEVI